MDSGDVEFSGGAVDYNPNESSSKDSGGPVDNMPVEKVAAEDVHFHASDITKLDEKEFFDNPKERKQREKEEEKRIRAEAKRVAKESKKHGRGRKGGASKEVAESEEALRREQSRIEGRQRKERLRGFFGAIAKRWYLFVAAIAIVAATVLGVIFVPEILKNISDAEDDKYVSENKTTLMALFEELAGKEMDREQLDGIISKYDGKVAAEYNEYGGKIHPDKYWLESIAMSLDAADGQTYYGFIYRNEAVLNGASISERGDAFIYSSEDKEQTFGTANEAVKAYLLDLRGGNK